MQHSGNWKNMKKLFLRISLLILIVVLAGLQAGCASSPAGGAAAGPDSPELQDWTVYGECLGGEADQFIVAELTFDREIKLSEGLPSQIRAVIGGKRIAEEDISAEQSGEKTVEIRLHVDRVVDGVLKLTNAPGNDTISALTDAEGRNCAGTLDVEKIVPSGVSIHEESAGEFAVDTVPTHRSIVWIRVRTEQGILPPGGAASTDVMDDAAAVHEHEFLWATTASVASDIADTVNQYYSPAVAAEARDNHVILRAADGSAAPSLEIYEG